MFGSYVYSTEMATFWLEKINLICDYFLATLCLFFVFRSKKIYFMLFKEINIFQI